MIHVSIPSDGGLGIVCLALHGNNCSLKYVWVLYILAVCRVGHDRIMVNFGGNSQPYVRPSLSDCQTEKLRKSRCDWQSLPAKPKNIVLPADDTNIDCRSTHIELGWYRLHCRGKVLDSPPSPPPPSAPPPPPPPPPKMLAIPPPPPSERWFEG